MAQNVKTVNGLAIASVKTFDALAIASVKTVLGVDNTSGGGLVVLSDTFAGDGSISGRNLTGGVGAWVQANSTLDTSGGDLRAVAGSFAKDVANVDAACGSIIQYLLTSIPTVSGTVFPAYIMRYVDGSSGYYAFEIDPSTGNWSWYKYDNAADLAANQIGAEINLNHSANDRWGITVTGTGAGTEVRIWKNPIANTPVSATEWDSGDTTPDGIWTDDPGADACDVGQKVGLQCFSSAANTAFASDFFAGGL